LKSRKSGRLARVGSPVTAGDVWVRPGTADMAIYDQIVLQPYLPRDRSFVTIIDCGANIGLSVRYLKAAYPDAVVVAVEPDEGNFGMLSRNTSGLKGVHCVKAGIWPVPGYLELRQEGLRHSSFRTKEASDDTGLEAVSIPLLMERFSLSRVSLLKIDIEGSELELFSGSDLSWIDRVDAIAIELHDGWRPGCGDAFFRAITSWSWTFSTYGGAILCEKRTAE